jgi:hypothetical protein
VLHQLVHRSSVRSVRPKPSVTYRMWQLLGPKHLINVLNAGSQRRRAAVHPDAPAGRHAAAAAAARAGGSSGGSHSGGHGGRQLPAKPQL